MSKEGIYGSLVQGTGLDTMFNMTKYAQDGILAVSINYRLGMFGFMNTFDEEKGVPKGGNYGYMDQGAAIKDSLTIITNA